MGKYKVKDISIVPSHVPGDIVDGYKYRVFKLPKQVQLISFIGHTKRGTYIYKQESPNRNYFLVEKWMAINLITNELEEYRVPVILEYRADTDYSSDEEYVDRDRPEGSFPNNLYEVNLLQDSYEAFLSNNRDRDNTGDFAIGWHLQLKINQHNQRLEKLKELIELEEDPKLKQGYLIHLMHKTNPIGISYRAMNKWGLENPRLLTKLRSNVYNTQPVNVV